MRVCELFAGVGGFRHGLEEAGGFDVVWANQWEPGRKTQHAFNCYVRHFPEGMHSNEDITTVRADKIPDHDLLVGGFPCQDYSVATTKAAGIHGKKGVLWWEIDRIIAAKKPPHVLLENVDRLLRSPTEQRGRDFAIMLHCLARLGYNVEWRVVNAADYGAPQRRRRAFIVAAHETTALGAAMAALGDRRDWLERNGFFAKTFPVVHDAARARTAIPPNGEVTGNLQKLSDTFTFFFENAGVMAGGKFWTKAVKAKAEAAVTLESVLQGDVPENYFIREGDLEQWRRLKGAKADNRQAKTGFRYRYTEGALPFPDPTDRSSRTVVTGEGGLAPSRFKHVILDPKKKRLRTLTPLEVERLNQFEDNWTEGMPESWRYFCMGNALVVGLIRDIGRKLHKWMEKAVPAEAAQTAIAKER